MRYRAPFIAACAATAIGVPLFAVEVDKATATTEAEISCEDASLKFFGHKHCLSRVSLLSHFRSWQDKGNFVIRTYTYPHPQFFFTHLRGA